MEEVNPEVSELERDESWTTVTKTKTSKNVGRDPIKVDVSKLTSRMRTSEQGMSINSIDKPGVSITPGGINGVSAKDGWEQVSVQVDSGAIDTVAPKDVAAEFPVRKTRAAKMGMGYVAANGTRIENHGERVVKGYTDDGTGIVMAMQVTDVKRTLGSVYRMHQAGIRVVLDGDDSYMVHKATGRVTPIYVDNGKFLFNIWVESNYKKNEDERMSQDEKKGRWRNINAFAALAEEEEQDESSKPNTGFNWLDEIF